MNSKEEGRNTKGRQRQRVPLLTLKRFSFENDWTKSARWNHLGRDQRGNAVELKETCSHMSPMQAKDG